LSDPDPAVHTKIENTVGHLGVDIEDALERAERTEIRYRPLAAAVTTPIIAI